MGSRLGVELQAKQRTGNVTGAGAGPVIELEYVADVACPWCYIGLERLKQALRLRPEIGIRLRWRPFILNPDLPPGGIDRATYLSAKFGHNAPRIYQRIEAVGRAEGIAFAFDRIRRQPETTDAHRLILYAQQQGRAPAMIDRLFRAFFREGDDVGIPARLLALATDAGFDPEAVGALLAGRDLVGEVQRAHSSAGWQGIRGVPVFILAETHALSGAQPAEVLAQLLDLAATPRPVAS